MRRIIGVSLLVMFAAWLLAGDEEKAPEAPSANNVQIDHSEKTKAPQTEAAQSAIAVALPKPAKALEVRYVNASALNIRSGPATSHRKIGKAARGSAVTLMGKVSGDWVYVSHQPSQSVGWMHTGYLKEQRAETTLKQSLKPEKAAKPVIAAAKSKPVSHSKPVKQRLNQSVNRDDAVKAIIRSSITGYSGSCPCPYNRDRAGRRCGGRSAYSRPGGYAPICYKGDVTASMLDQWLSRNGG